MTGGTTRKKKVILVVDDFTDGREMYAEYLEHMGYDVVVARNGSDAVAIAMSQNPDVILMDLSMPVMNGLEATRQLKEAEQTRGIPIVAFTGHVSADSAAAALRAGCDEFIAKPATPDLVEATLRKMLTASGKGSSALLAKAKKPRKT